MLTCFQLYHTWKMLKTKRRFRTFELCFYQHGNMHFIKSSRFFFIHNANYGNLHVELQWLSVCDHMCEPIVAYFSGCACNILPRICVVTKSSYTIKVLTLPDAHDDNCSCTVSSCLSLILSCSSSVERRVLNASWFSFNAATSVNSCSMSPASQAADRQQQPMLEIMIKLKNVILNQKLNR